MFLPCPRVKVSIVGSLRDQEVACSASDCQGSNFESCFWRTVYLNTFIWIPMPCIYDDYAYFNSFSAGSLYTSQSDVYRRQIPTTKDHPRAEIIKVVSTVCQHWFNVSCFLGGYMNDWMNERSNKWDFRPLLCTYRLNWAWETYGWWDESDETASRHVIRKFGPTRAETEQATAQSRRLPTALNHL